MRDELNNDPENARRIEQERQPYLPWHHMLTIAPHTYNSTTMHGYAYSSYTCSAYSGYAYIEQEWFHNVKLGIAHQVKNMPKKERQVPL